MTYQSAVMGKLVGESDSEEDLVAAFLPFDKSASGYVSVDDFRHAMTRLGKLYLTDDSEFC